MWEHLKYNLKKKMKKLKADLGFSWFHMKNIHQRYDRKDTTRTKKHLTLRNGQELQYEEDDFQNLLLLAVYDILSNIYFWGGNVPNLATKLLIGLRLVEIMPYIVVIYDPIRVNAQEKEMPFDYHFNLCLWVFWFY